MESPYYLSKKSVAEYIEAAKDFNGAALIEKLKKYLPPGSSLLELGSGPGSDFKILKEHYNCVGSDFSHEFLEHLKHRFPGDQFLQLEAQSLKTNENFAGIYSNKVLQHLKDEELGPSLKRQAAILESPGIVCHSFWCGKGEEKFKGMLVNYQNKESLAQFFDPYFKILLLEEYAEFEAGDSLLVIAQKKTTNK